MWLEVLPLCHPSHGFGVQERPHARGLGWAEWRRSLCKLGHESPLSRAYYVLGVGVLGAAGWGPARPRLLGEDLLGANTDREYMATQSRQESTGEGSLRVGARLKAPDLPLGSENSSSPPDRCVMKTPKVGLTGPFPGGYQDCVESCFAVHWSRARSSLCLVIQKIGTMLGPAYQSCGLGGGEVEEGCI